MRLLATIAFVSLVSVCALASAAETSDEEGARRREAFSQTYESPDDDALRFQGLEPVRPRQLTDGFLGIPLKQQLRENLTLGVTENGINWRFDW